MSYKNLLIHNCIREGQETTEKSFNWSDWCLHYNGDIIHTDSKYVAILYKGTSRDSYYS